MSRKTGFAYIRTALTGVGYNMMLKATQVTPSFTEQNFCRTDRGLLYFIR